MNVIIKIIIISFLTSSCYLTKQGYRQISILTSREPLEEVLKGNSLTPEQSKKLAFSKQIFSYAKKQGFHVDGAYNTFVRLDGEAVSYTVQAAKPTELVLKTWWFPFLGSVPYLGFFDKIDRDEEASKLELDGFETYKGSVTAFSSLGWFSDPVYSSMLNRSDVELAHLFFHELTHRTLWLKDGAEFNENLAEFIADRTTKKFFEDLNRSAEWVIFMTQLEDYAHFRVWLFQLRNDIQNSFELNRNAAPEVKIDHRNRIIQNAMEHKPIFKKYDFVGSKFWNTARILAAGLYSPDTERFSLAAKCYEDKIGPFHPGEFLSHLDRLSKIYGTGFQAMDSMCS